MKNAKILNKIVNKYGMKHGDLIGINELKYISCKECIKIDDVINILGISDTSKYYIKRNSINKTRIKIFNIEELKEIELSG